MELAWYFGLPPILPERNVFVLRRPWRQRVMPPISEREYKYERKGEIEEKIEFKRDKYEYKYAQKQMGIEEKLEIKRDKYEYKYSDRQYEEKLEVKFPSNRYEYHFKNKYSGEEIKDEGIGRPVTPNILYQELRQVEQKNPRFHLSVRINLNR